MSFLCELFLKSNIGNEEINDYEIWALVFFLFLNFYKEYGIYGFNQVKFFFKRLPSDFQVV